MIRVRTVTDFDVLDAVRETAKQAPARMRRKLDAIARGPRAQRLIIRLSSEPGRPRYPLRWKSAKQRRYVMAKLREAGNLPYERSHAISRGWVFLLDSIQEGQGSFIAQNPARGVEYVQGDYAQMMHIDTGWPQAAPIIQEFAAGFESDVIDAWYEVTTL